MTLSLVAALALSAAPAKSQPYTIQDQVTMRRISNPSVSPDGKRIAFVLRTTDLEANKGRTDLWLVNADGSGLRQLTQSPESEGQPVWGPDGQSLYFLSSRGGSSQVFRLPLDGGESRAVTKLPLDVGAFALSRDGKTLAVALEVYPDCPTLECTTQRQKEQAQKKTTGRVYDKLFARHWDAWSDGRRNHLFVLPVDGSAAPRDVMVGMDADGPSKPFGGPEEFTFTPDGKGLVFTARDVGASESWSTDLDLFLAPLDKPGAPKKLTEKNRATDTQPVFSPDGKTLAYLAMSRPGFESDRLRVVLRSWPEGKERVLAEPWDRSAGSLAWTADGKSVLVTADDIGQHPVFSIDVASGQVRALSGPGSAGEPQPLPDGRVVFLRDDLKSPADLYSVHADGSELRQLTRVNEEAVARIRFGDYEQFEFPGWNGETVRGYVVKPADFDPKKKYPVAFLIHGGPQGSFGNHFHYRWNPQTYAGRGYAAVMIDFHGSTGYGQAFTDAISGDWGGKPLEDLQKGLEAAIKRYGFLDGDKVCALGASYGGYMINWIAGQMPDRFRCLVTHDGNLDEKLAYFNTEELWFPEWEHGGTPWEKPEGYTKHNPIDHVAKWKTPMLVIHGGQDFRVVDTQGLATFTVLQRRGIPSKLIYFPDENHWVVKPANSIQWHDAVLDWLDQWTKGAKKPAGPSVAPTAKAAQ
ncbi:S9 family peptidase [Vitiosangium sp. GDMCC 1.1324]|uniref:dipeptidyl-peptidase 5 n=1 Tax=Vitiosangium sp. (strain GDMCC 1.1324) TaxID=2138576 RepID=UPI000D339ADD|nr:S9 family peptidase [Vitiosangium sp. GDMCC 1.1324]PTL80613.1 peptidase S9 [Vitiosangium sp. GDMCC 1.1324]